MGYSIGEAISFKDIFEKELEYKPVLGTVIEYNTARVYGYEHIVFVEGSSDKKFYSRTNIKKLSDNVFYIFATQDDSYVGKEAVFEAYFEIINNENLYDDYKRCIFIVDRDWDDYLKSKNNIIGKDDQKEFCVTHGHSMESYFLSYHNLNVVFNNSGLSKVDLEAFWEQFIEFAKDTAEFWALKATVTYANKERIRIRYKKQYDFNRIFHFKYDNEMEYRRDYLKTEISEMKKAISGLSELVKYSDEKLKMFLSNPQMVRGHDAFHFLQCYLKNKYGIKLDLDKTEKALLDKTIYDFEVVFCTL